MYCVTHKHEQSKNTGREGLPGSDVISLFRFNFGVCKLVLKVDESNRNQVTAFCVSIRDFKKEESKV